MRKSASDLIVAPITAVPGPVALVRLAGEGAWELGAQLISPWSSQPERNTVRYGKLVHGDDGLVSIFSVGRSFTGDETLEFSMHGSRVSVSIFLEHCYRLGARLADPGEFSQRAFLNGRMDLTQVEAIRDSIEAASHIHFKLATQNREGALSGRITALRSEVSKLLSLIDVSVDFSEELGDFDYVGVTSQLESLAGALGTLAHQAIPSRYVRQGLRIALVGQPNAGKSSLFNYLLGRDRAIVTEVAGTTRDTIEEASEIGGVPVVLIDTAGLREALDKVEELGIARTRVVLGLADVAFYLFDGTIGWDAQDEILLRECKIPTLVVATKADLGVKADDYHAVSSSAGIGMDHVVEWVTKMADLESLEVLISPDQETSLIEASRSVQSAASVLQHELPFDLATVHLQEALHLLGQITGETADEDMLTRMFSNFCVGK